MKCVSFFSFFSTCPVGLWPVEMLTSRQILEQLGEMYFGIQIKRSSNFLDMMGSLLGGGGGAPSAEPKRGQIETAVDLD